MSEIVVQAREGAIRGARLDGIVRFPGLDVEPRIGSGWRKGDDYLNVNVRAPDGPSESGPRPGTVWIHGGFVPGSNHSAIQDGTAFARSGVVCIAITGAAMDSHVDASIADILKAAAAGLP